MLEKNNLMNKAPEMLSPSHWSRWEFCYWLQLSQGFASGQDLCVMNNNEWLRKTKQWSVLLKKKKKSAKRLL